MKNIIIGIFAAAVFISLLMLLGWHMPGGAEFIGGTIPK